MRRLMMFFGAGMFFVAASAYAAAAPDAMLQHSLDGLRTRATADQYALFVNAINASPELTRQLNGLEEQGLFIEFRIDQNPPSASRRMPFSARREGLVWVFSPAFLQQQAKTRLYDVVQSDDVLPDNMVFALGHLAFKAATASALLATAQSLQAQLRASHQAGQGMAMTPDMFLRSAVNAHLQNDAGAFIQAWNDTLDAAVHANGGRELSIRQTASLLMNLRYRAVFLKAMRSPDHKLLFAHNGYLEPDQAHRDAIAAVLGTMPVYDLE